MRLRVYLVKQCLPLAKVSFIGFDCTID